ncbi:MAG: hypothetical protein M3083_18760 [Actinomycetota bacterium]|nr:hypothetical protein [Actinomycetota bacterium]
MPEPATGDRWAVVLEVKPGPGQGPCEIETVRQLVFCLRELRATALYSADRYAVQLDVEAASFSDALRMALAAHRQALDELGLTAPVFLRAEVLTREVLQDEWEGGSADAAPRCDMTTVPAGVYQATRALLQATTVAQIRAVLVQFVVESGGSVHVGPSSPEPGIVATGLGFSPDEQVHATAEAMSMAGMLIQLSLPALVDDARLVGQRLRRQPDCR